MIVLDANRIEKTFSSNQVVGIPWQTVGAFLRIVTNSKLPGQLVTLDRAVEVVDQWMEQPNVRMLAPGERHLPILRQMVTEGRARGPLFTDAQLAALTIEHGAVLHTTDRDFARFPGLLDESARLVAPSWNKPRFGRVIQYY